MFIRSNQQLFLEPEVIEQTTLPHAGASRDAIQRNGGHADVSYQLQSGIQYPVARTRTAALRRFPLIRHLTSVPTGGSPRTSAPGMVGLTIPSRRYIEYSAAATFSHCNRRAAQFST